MVHKVGVVAGDLVSAAGMGAGVARQGYAVRIFTAQADLERLPERLAAVRADVVIIAVGADAQQQGRAAAALERWGATVTAGDRWGAAGTAGALPEGLGAPEPFDPLAGLYLGAPGGTLVLSGSTAPEARAQLDRLADDGALLLTLRRETVLGHDETFLMGIRSGAAAAVRQGQNVIVRSENWPQAAEMTRRMAAKRGISAEELGRRVLNMLARVGEGVIEGAVTTTETTRRLIAVGTDTSTELCRLLGIKELVVLSAVSPDVTAVLAPGPKPLLLVLKSGSSGGPDALAKAMTYLSAFQTKRGH